MPCASSSRPHGDQLDTGRDDIAQLPVRAERANAAAELDAGTAAEALPCGDGDDADRASARDVRAAAGGDVEAFHLDDPAAGRFATTPCAAAGPAHPRRRRSGSSPASRPRPPGSQRPRRSSISAGVTSRARSIVDPDRRRDESSWCERRAAGRTRPTARAARCAAACARTAVPNRRRAATRPCGGSPSTMCRMLPSSRSTTSTTRRRRACRCRTAGRRRSDRTPSDRARSRVAHRGVATSDDVGLELGQIRIGVVETLGHQRRALVLRATCERARATCCP